jgi:hypothetical protein
VGPDRLFEKHHTVLSDILTVNDVRTASELVFLGDKYMYSCTRNARVKLQQLFHEVWAIYRFLRALFRSRFCKTILYLFVLGGL